MDFWIDKIDINDRVILGRFCRTQINNLPPRVSESRTLEPLGVREIGQTTIWQYDGELSVMAIEVSRNGVSLSRLIAYVRAICHCPGYGHLPVLDDTALAAAEAGRIRELSFRVATPNDLSAVAADERTMKQGMTDLMGTEIATQVEIRYSVKARDPDIRLGRFQRAVSWLRGERDADRGGISKLQARIVDEEGNSRALNLLSAHLGSMSDLDLPDDDPDASAQIRKVNIAQAFNTHRPSLIRQFGQ
jgi:hypothetical protein